MSRVPKDGPEDVSKAGLRGDQPRDPAADLAAIHDGSRTDSLAADLRLATLWRCLSSITPAVAHDLRAPVNAMAFNLELLKDTIGRAADPAARERLPRYLAVLQEELQRLHRGMEIYLAQIAPRGDRGETFDLREPVGDLAALLAGPARNRTARIAASLPAAPLVVPGNRLLITQALLLVAVAALATVPRGGTLEIALERQTERAQVRFSSGGGKAGMEEGGPPAGASPDGSREQLWAARAILAGLGGAVRAIVEAPGELPEFEIELGLTHGSGIREEE
jgi:two-component system, NtrC family, sensor kinase